MQVFYEDEGALKVGAVLADNVTSLQVEAPHGKRSKIKSSSVLMRFEEPRIADFMAQAQQAADQLDLDFLWECSSGDEFGHETLAREYYGREPSPTEAAGVLLKLHGAPMYFYKRGRGHYQAAPPDALKAALASVQRKQEQAKKKDAYIGQLSAGTLPPDFEPVLPMLLYKPDRNTIEWKALDEAASSSRLTPARVIERCGGLPSTHDYHLNRFLFEYFPAGTSFAESLPVETSPGDLALSDAAAFSIDDVSTTEIDDAFSVTVLANGNRRFGIHIAAPSLGTAPESPLDAAARERLSTVYFPGAKITMLPERAIEEYTLAAQRECPALSLYTELTPGFELVGTQTVVERVRIADNLRHEILEPLVNETSVAGETVAHVYGDEFGRLWQWARRLEQLRRGDTPEGEQRPEYNFRVDGDRVQITRRMRGTPIDKIVSELMIYVNSTWGRQLAESATAAIYRVQSAGKVRMSTVPSAHAGLGVEQYAWASSPLRRYVDLVNQRQLIALAHGEEPPYRPGDERLSAIMREFEIAHEIYSEFQRMMERYWCLRWLLQEGADTVVATVLRENLCRFDELPLVVRVASLPTLPSGAHVVLAITSIDLLELTFHAEFRSELRESNDLDQSSAAQHV